MKNDKFKDLIESGQLKAEPNAGKDQVERLLKRADKDLESASVVSDFDQAVAMTCAYNAMFHAANALLRLHGYRPGPVKKHQGVIEAVRRLLGKEVDSLIQRFDRLRKRRNELEYQGIFEMGAQELKEAIGHAEKFVDCVKKAIGKI